MYLVLSGVSIQGQTVYGGQSQTIVFEGLERGLRVQFARRPERFEVGAYFQRGVEQGQK